MADLVWSLLGGILVHGGDVDVYDDTIGYGRAWVLTDGDDVVDAVLRRIASETVLVEDAGQDLTADIWGWCEANLDVLTRFGKEWNHGGAQIDGTDDGIAHAVTTVQQLATGDYCEDAYRWLADEWGLRDEPPRPRRGRPRGRLRGGPDDGRRAPHGRRDAGGRRAVRREDRRQGHGRRPGPHRGANRFISARREEWSLEGGR